MKTSKLTFAAGTALLLSAALTSCSNDDNEPKWDDEGSKIELPDHRMFILNEGTQQLNNANIALYDPETNVLTKDIFASQNGMNLGDTGQDMIRHDDNIYVSVYGSNYLAKLNAAGVEKGRVSFASDPELQGKVRYLAAKGDHIYASFYGGVIAKINANTLEVEKKLSGLGNNIEGIAIADSILYVANSYRHGDNGYEYLEDMYQISLNTLSLKGVFYVSPNPNQVLEADGKIFVISWGNYNDRGYEFQMVDPKLDNKVTVLATATKMGAGNDMIYLVNSVTDYSHWPETITENTFFYYDIKAGKIVEKSFIDDPDNKLKNESISMIEVDEQTGDIYIGATNYSASNGKIYRISRSGSIISEFDCGGQNPRTAVFFGR